MMLKCFYYVLISDQCFIVVVVSLLHVYNSVYTVNIVFNYLNFLFHFLEVF